MKEDLVIEIVKKTNFIVNLEDDDGDTIFHWAAYNDTMESLLEYLLSREDTVIDKQNMDGYTPLHCAVYSNNLNAVRMLLENDCDINIINNARETALDVAKQNKRKEIKSLLKKA